MEERNLWWVQCENWTQWEPLPEVLEINNPVIREMQLVQSTKDILFDKDSSSGLDEGKDSGTETGKFSNKSLTNEYIVRAHPRYEVDLLIRIQCNGKVFESRSQDVSVGGILLKNPLPEWVFGYCQVRLIDVSTKQAVSLTCSIVENQEPDKRLRIALAPLENHAAEQKFDRWLQKVAA